jgi:hypothetical protein
MSSADPHITPLIRKIRDHRVILDADLAALYGVPTKRFNEAFKRARDRFPPEFAFQLTAGESVALNWPQTATSSRQIIENQEIMSRDCRQLQLERSGQVKHPVIFLPTSAACCSRDSEETGGSPSFPRNPIPLCPALIRPRADFGARP